MSFECLKNCGRCCGPVQISKEIFEKNKDKATSIEYKLDDGKTVMAVRADGKCAFLTEEMKCAIYEERPQVCKDFGSNPRGHLLLCCPFIREDGTKRNRPERRKAMRILDKKTDKVMERLEREFEG
jgi:Fe-S-cluster containining protein